jgi:hypothetical protein
MTESKNDSSAGNQDQRASPRYVACWRAIAMAPGMEPVYVKTRDVSMTGLSIVSEKKLKEVGEKIIIRVIVPKGSLLKESISFDIPCAAVYTFISGDLIIYGMKVLVTDNPIAPIISALEKRSAGSL